MYGFLRRACHLTLLCMLVTSIYFLLSTSDTMSKLDFVSNDHHHHHTHTGRELHKDHVTAPEATSLSDIRSISASGHVTDIPPQKDPITEAIEPTDARADPKTEKWAYAFYAPNEQYLCYALINANRLFKNLQIKSNIDVILIVSKSSGHDKICTTECFPDGRLKLFHTPEPGDDYDKLFRPFEVFGMHDYSRIALVDSDGIVMKNLDHIFEIDLDGKNVATTVATFNSTEILTTMIMVVEPSQNLLERVSKFQNPTAVAEALADHENNPSFAYSSDADIILNQMFKERLVSVKRLPADYTSLDTSPTNMSNAYFVSFENRPLEAPDGDKTLDDNAVNAVLLQATGPNSTSYPLSIFWQHYYKTCDGLMESA